MRKTKFINKRGEAKKARDATYITCGICGEPYNADSSGCVAAYCDSCGCQYDYDSFENGCDNCPDLAEGVK